MIAWRWRGEDERKDPAGAAVDRSREIEPVAVGELGGEHHLDQREEDEQRTHQDERIEPREIGQLWHLGIDGEPIRDEREHGGDGDAHLRRCIVRLDPKHGPRHHHDEDQRDNDLDHEVVRIARSGELEGITGNLNSRGDAVRLYACAGGNHSPILNRQLFREADSLAHPGGERHRVGGELDLFRSISEHDDLHAEGVAVEREGAQIQRLREGADEPLPIRRRAIGRHFGDLGQRTRDLAGFVRDEEGRMPDVIERVPLRAGPGVREFRVAPA